MKETELEVLNHQLQGIMDCSDMMNLFCLLKLSHPYGQQRRRMNGLMAAFRQVNQLYINKYQEIPKVSTTFQRAFVTATPDNKELVAIVINSWINWETKGINLYTQLLEQTTKAPERRLWIRLLSMSKICLQTAKACKQKYTPQTYQAETPVTTTTTTTTTNLQQRMQERLAATQS